MYLLPLFSIPLNLTTILCIPLLCGGVRGGRKKGRSQVSEPKTDYPIL